MAVCDETKPYVFISYSHRDTERVVEIMNRLRAEGFNIWYDGGIDPGTEWDENIAMHVKNCAYFIAFVSDGYINSKNCKDELNYSRDLDKEQLLVYLDDVQLPDGMAMRMNRIQAIFWCKYDKSNIEEAYHKLFSAKGIEKARVHNTEHQTDISVKPEDYTAPVSTNSANNDRGNSNKNSNNKLFIIIGIIVIVVAIISGILIYANSKNSTSDTKKEETETESYSEDEDEKEEKKSKDEDLSKEEKTEENDSDKVDEDNSTKDESSNTDSSNLYADYSNDELWEKVNVLYDSKKYTAAFDMLVELANRGDGNACGYLVFYYGQEEKSGDKVDFGEAKKWGEKGIELGNGYSAFALQIIYYNGVGDTHEYLNYDLSLKYGLKAVELKNYQGARALGEIYFFGYSMKGKDYIEAKKYFEIGSENQGDGYCSSYLGFMYDYGQGIDIDYDKAFEYYKLAIEQNHPYSNLRLGDMYRYGHATAGLTKEMALNCYQTILDNYSSNKEWADWASEGIEAINAMK